MGLLSYQPGRALEEFGRRLADATGQPIMPANMLGRVNRKGLAGMFSAKTWRRVPGGLTKNLPVTQGDSEGGAPEEINLGTGLS